MPGSHGGGAERHTLPCLGAAGGLLQTTPSSPPGGVWLRLWSPHKPSPTSDAQGSDTRSRALGRGCPVAGASHGSTTRVGGGTSETSLRTSLSQYRLWAILFTHPFLRGCSHPLVSSGGCGQGSRTGTRPSPGNWRWWFLLVRGGLSKQQHPKEGCRDPTNFPGWSLIPQNFMPYKFHASAGSIPWRGRQDSRLSTLSSFLQANKSPLLPSPPDFHPGAVFLSPDPGNLCQHPDTSLQTAGRKGTINTERELQANEEGTQLQFGWVFASAKTNCCQQKSTPIKQIKLVSK